MNDVCMRLCLCVLCVFVSVSVCVCVCCVFLWLCVCARCASHCFPFIRYDVTAKGSLIVHAFTFAGLDGCEVMGAPVYCHAQQHSTNSNNATRLPSSGESQASGDMFDPSDNSVALVVDAAGLLADLDCSAPFTESQFESSLAYVDKECHGDGGQCRTLPLCTCTVANHKQNNHVFAYSLFE